MMSGSDDGIQAELLSGESLLWSGRPRPGFLLRTHDWFMIPFGLFFLAMPLTIFFIAASEPPIHGANATPPGFILLIFFLPFIAIGSYLTFGHLLWERAVRSRTSYGVGTITFNESSNLFVPFAAWGMWGYQSAPAFELIDHAQDVFKLVGETRAKFLS